MNLIKPDEINIAIDYTPGQSMVPVDVQVGNPHANTVKVCRTGGATRLEAVAAPILAAIVQNEGVGDHAAQVEVATTYAARLLDACERICSEHKAL